MTHEQTLINLTLGAAILLLLGCDDANAGGDEDDQLKTENSAGFLEKLFRNLKGIIRLEKTRLFHFSYLTILTADAQG